MLNKKQNLIKMLFTNLILLIELKMVLKISLKTNQNSKKLVIIIRRLKKKKKRKIMIINKQKKQKYLLQKVEK